MTWTLADITARMQGRILYVGNPGQNYTLQDWDMVFAQAKRWGFDGIAPKLADGNTTWYASDAALRAIIAHAHSQGLSCWPWVYVYANTIVRGADICSEIAQAVGLSVADIEQPTDMNAFVAEYKRQAMGSPPLLVTTAGDPLTFTTGWPGRSLIDAVGIASPQMYVGTWMQGPYCRGLSVVECFNKADLEWARVGGSSFPIIPSLSVVGLSPDQCTQLATYAANWKCPVLWWHHGAMTDANAAAIMAAPVGFPVPASPPAPPDPCADVRAQLAQLTTENARLQGLNTLYTQALRDIQGAVLRALGTGK